MARENQRGMTANTRSAEQASLLTVPVLGGVEVMRATFVTQTFSRHFHEGYGLGCIERGAMRFHYLGSGMVASQGQVNLVVPGEVHDGHAAVDQGWAYRMFYLRPEALVEAARELMPRPEANHSWPHFRQGVINDPDLAARIRAVHRLFQDPEVSLLEKETRMLDLLSQWIHRHADKRGNWPKTRPEHRAAAQAREYLSANPGKDVSLKDLAGVAGLSPFHLVRVFEREYGITPHAYLTQARVKLARDLLGTDKRLADIAQETGFADQAHLTRQFKRRFGLTPGRFRRALKA